MDPLTSADGNVEVMIPLDLRNASIVRVVAAALGADSGYSMDEIDDFRLALNEAFALLVDASPAPARAHHVHTGRRRTDGDLATIGRHPAGHPGHAGGRHPAGCGGWDEHRRPGDPPAEAGGGVGSSTATNALAPGR